MSSLRGEFQVDDVTICFGMINDVGCRAWRKRRRGLVSGQEHMTRKLICESALNALTVCYQVSNFIIS